MNLPRPILLATLLLAATSVAVGCQPASPPSAGSSTSAEVDEHGQLKPLAPRGPSAQLVSQQSRTNPLDADRAMGYLTHVANIGPRPCGSQGMIEQQKYVTEHFEKLGATVSQQKFTFPHPLDRRPVPGVNLIVQWHPDRTDRVLVCAHYDTRPLPDEDPNPERRRNGRFIGANDGASGVALLMELGHHLAEFDPAVGIDFVLFDAEDFVYGEKLTRTGYVGTYCVGSEFFARQYRTDRDRNFKYHWGVLVDMVGDANLEIRQELQTVRWRDTRPLVRDIWTIAARLGVKEFVARTTDTPVIDDHVQLRNIAKIPTINLIDVDYPDVGFGQPGSYWHTEQDIPANCSGESVAKVGWVVLEWLRTVEVPQAPTAGPPRR